MVNKTKRSGRKVYPRLILVQDVNIYGSMLGKVCVIAINAVASTLF